MKLLLDTCVLSEYMKKNPHQAVINWLDRQNKLRLFMSAISLAEIKKGTFKIQYKEPPRYERLFQWIIDLERQFSGRILPVNSEVLHTWAKLMASNEIKGKCLPVMDSLIAATALTHNMAIVTRNIQDFKFISATVINPWEL